MSAGTPSGTTTPVLAFPSNLSYSQVKQLLINNGVSAQWAPTLAGIAYFESGGHYNSLNNNPSTGDYSVGLFQINFYGGNAGRAQQAPYGGKPGNTVLQTAGALQTDPNQQAQAAAYLLGNGAGITNWKGDRAGNAAIANGGPLTDAQVMALLPASYINGTNTPIPPSVSGQGGLTPGQIGNGLYTVAGAPGQLASAAGSGILSFLGIPNINWTAVGGMAIAIMLILVGVYIMFHSQINSAVKTAGTKGAEAAAA